MTAQAMEALAYGNELRFEACRFRKDVASRPYPDGYLALVNQLRADEIPPGVGSMRVERFLRSAHRMGERKVLRLLREAGVWRRSARVRELTVGERERICVAIERWVAKS